MRRRAILIDTDPAMLNTAREVFAAAGDDIVCAPGDYEVSAALAGPQPSHVILDPGNSRIEALDLLDRIAALPERPSLILVGHLGSRLLEATKQTALNKGFRVVGVAQKPVSASRLASLLASTRDASEDAPTLAGTIAQIPSDDIHAAIRHDQIAFVYQPRIECRTRALAGFEALARWPGAAPRDFIAAAEKLGLIRTLTRRLAAIGIRWLGVTFPDGLYTLSINLSPACMNDHGLPEYLATLCRYFHVDTSRIVLELGEPATTGSAALEQVTRFRLKGFRVALDDAGTVHSSLEQLLKLPFSEMEIDRTFVRRAVASDECRNIVDAMIQVGHRLHLGVIGKGVESSDSLAYLAEKDCDYAQGFYIAPPLEPHVAAEWRPSS